MKVLVSDFDGTLFTTLEELNQNKKKIEIFRHGGNLFIIATGRNLTSIKNEIEKFQIPFDYLICNDGAMIFDQKFNCLRQTFLSSIAKNKISKLLHDYPEPLQWYFDDGTNYTKEITNLVNKIIIKVGVRCQAEQLLQKIQQEIPELDGYISNNWINIMDKSINKSTAIKQIQELLQVPGYDIYTIGDNENDKQMLMDYHGYRIKGTFHDELLNSNVIEVDSVAILIDKLIKKE